jgi:AraC family transcriptional regulator, arabinose operon regulatory protein
MGTSPMQYLRTVRVEAAKRLLVTIETPVGEVAAQVGFEDPLYFSRVFRKVTGKSPTAYREATNCTE